MPSSAHQRHLLGCNDFMMHGPSARVTRFDNLSPPFPPLFALLPSHLPLASLPSPLLQPRRDPTMPSTDENSTDTDNVDNTDADDTESLIDHSVFDQLTEMDDEEDHEFSKSIVWNYFDQAGTTFEDMDAALEKKDLAELSRLGHFLKGSSAALGLRKVKATCEKIQHVGNLKDEEGVNHIEEEEALEKVTKLLTQVNEEYAEAEVYLRKYYDDPDGQ